MKPMQHMHQEMKPAQQGNVLFITLIFLLLLSITASAVIRSATTGLRMTANEQTRLSTLSLAQSIADSVLVQRSNFPLAGPPGTRFCTVNVSGCGTQPISINSALLSTDKQRYARVLVERLPPDLAPPPAALGLDASIFSMARFQVTVEYDGRAINEGRAGVVQGVTLLQPQPASGRSLWKTFWYEKDVD